MRFKWIRVHKLAFAVLLVATCMIGWVTTVTVAQNQSQSQSSTQPHHLTFTIGSSEDPEKAAMAPSSGMRSSRKLSSRV